MKGMRSINDASAATANFWILSVMLVCAPLYRGGNRPLPLLALELLAYLLIVLSLMRPLWKDHVSIIMRGTLLVTALMPLVYLVPIPQALWLELPGRVFYNPILKLTGEDLHWRAMSIVPSDTEAAFYTLLLPIGIFFGAIGLSTRRLQFLVMLTLSVAAGEAFLGLIQFAGGVDGSLYWGIEPSHRSALGTYVNRNHLAGLLVMTLPTALALFASAIGGRGPNPGVKFPVTWKGHMVSFLERIARPGILYGLSALLILLGIIFTRSRSGVALAMLAILFAMFFFSRPMGRHGSIRTLGLVTVLVLVVAGEIGLFPIWQRFAVDHPLGHIRWSVFSSTVDGIGAFFPLGSGPGTFLHVYPRFQPQELYGTLVNHAHNDYLEFLMEWGLAGAVIILLLIIFYLGRWPSVWTRGDWSRFRYCQVGAGIGLLLLALHGLTDFNFHIPANAAYFAFLAAVFFHQHRESDQPPAATPQRRTRGRTPSTARPPATSTSSASNPFLD